MNLKTITIADLEKSKSNSVYVLNKTTKLEKGNVIVSVAKKNGTGVDTVLVPDTFIPVALTDQVSKIQLLDSSEFRAALSSRRLVLVDSNEAEALLNTKEAQKESNRIYKEKEQFRNNVVDLDKMSEANDNNSQGFKDMVNSLNGPSDEETKIKPAILQLVADLNELGDEDSSISTLRNIEDVKRRDYRYVYKNVNKKHKEIIKYSKLQCELIAERRKNK